MNIFRLLEYPRSSEELGSWHQYIGDFDQVIGYSVLGAIFLRSSGTAGYLVLYPLRSGNNAKNYGEFSSISEFESKILRHPSFAEACLYPVKEEEISLLEKSLGGLEQEQVYFPVPHPSIGGSWCISTYKKGNLWVFADIACQNHGW